MFVRKSRSKLVAADVVVEEAVVDVSGYGGRSR
jgi:hypothetical protein